MRLAVSLAPLLLCLAPCVGQKVTPPSGEAPLRVSPPVVDVTLAAQNAPAPDTLAAPGTVAHRLGETNRRTSDGPVVGTGLVESIFSYANSLTAEPLDSHNGLSHDGLSLDGLSLDGLRIAGAAEAGPQPADAGTRGPIAPPEGPPPVPEPSTLLLVGTGLIGVALTSRLSRRRSQSD